MKLRDAEKTDIMRGLLREKYDQVAGNGARYSLIEEVGVATGFRCDRWADALMQELWPSDGLNLWGFELKASRSDLRHELADLEKHQTFAQYCHRWVLVTWDTAVVGTLTIPETWGWWTVNQDQDGFEVQRKPPVLSPPELLPRSFMAAVMRRAVEASPCATWTGHVAARAFMEGRRDGEYEVARMKRELRLMEQRLAEQRARPA